MSLKFIGGVSKKLGPIDRGLPFVAARRQPPRHSPLRTATTR
jgi:hypothetical protein